MIGSRRVSHFNPREGILRSLSMSRVLRVLTVLMLSVLASPQLGYTQEVSATLGVTRTIRSTILSEDTKVDLESASNSIGTRHRDDGRELSGTEMEM